VIPHVLRTEDLLLEVIAAAKLLEDGLAELVAV